MSSTLFKVGMGSVMVARTLPSGLLGCAHFLLDVYCRGVKDVFYDDLGPTELRSHLDMQADLQGIDDIEPAYARKLIRDAAAYAADLGLPAAKNTAVIEAIFGDVDPDACAEVFAFGLNGKPMFMPGPHDTPARIHATDRALSAARPDLIASPDDPHLQSTVPAAVALAGAGAAYPR